LIADEDSQRESSVLDGHPADSGGRVVDPPMMRSLVAESDKSVNALSFPVSEKCGQIGQENQSLPEWKKEVLTRTFFFLFLFCFLSLLFFLPHVSYPLPPPVEGSTPCLHASI